LRGGRNMHEAHFNLSRKPFRLSPDASFFYASKTHQRALSYLEYGLYQNEGFLVLTGDPGTGKTTLLHKLEELLSHQFYVARIDVSPEMTTLSLLQLIAISFNITNIQDLNEAELFIKIRDFLLSHLHHNRKAIVFIDECHHLSYQALEELRLLTNIQHREIALIQCFLVGQSSFRNIIKAPELEQLSQRIIATCHLKSLNKQETKEYIQHRLKTAGHVDANIFSAGASNIVYKFTSGNPRRINRVCDRALLCASIEEQHYIDEQVICDVIEELVDEMEVSFDVNHYRTMIVDTEEKEFPREANGIICLDSHRSTARNLKTSNVKVVSYASPQEKVISSPTDNNIQLVKDVPTNTDISTQPNLPLHTENKINKKHTFRPDIIVISVLLVVSVPLILTTISSPEKLDKPWDSTLSSTQITDNSNQTRVAPALTDSQSNNHIARSRNEATYVSHNITSKAVISTEENKDVSNKLVTIEKQNDTKVLLSNKLTSHKQSSPKPIKVSLTAPTQKEPPENPLKDSKKDKNSSAIKNNNANKIKQNSKPAIKEKIQLLSEIKLAQKTHPTPTILTKSENKKEIDTSPTTQLNKKQKQVASNIQIPQLSPPTRYLLPPLTTKKINELDPENLHEIINEFTSAYKGGDVASISSVLSEDIKTNDSNDRNSLTAQYEKLFSITDNRELKLTEISWETKTGKAAGEGNFQATILEKGRTNPQIYAGTFTVSIEKRNTQLAITDMRYEYE